jgi:hypothetical protein
MPKMMDYVFDIMSNKNHLLHQDPENVKGFDPFITNRALSMNLDTIMWANEMNKAHSLPKEMQYDFLFFGIPKRRRQFSWKKKTKLDNIVVIQQYYECSYAKALEMSRLLTDDDVNDMIAALDPGGATKRKGK